MELKGYCFILYALLFFSIVTIPVSGFTITTDNISETSIVWNLSQRGAVNISSIAFDGIEVEDFITNPTAIVQNNLWADETHIITVIDDTGGISTATAKTSRSQNTLFMTTINAWILIIIAAFFTCCAIFIRLPFLAFIGALFCFMGLVSSIGESFITGLISVIMVVTSLFVGFSEMNSY